MQPTRMLAKTLQDRLDPGFSTWLEATQVPLPPGYQPSLEEMRAGYAKTMAPWTGTVDPQLEVEDLVLSLDGQAPVQARLYRPPGTGQTRPVCVFAHGGGWVLGDLDTHAGVCSDLAMGAGCAVLALHYRRSPEHVFPAALNDCQSALQWVQAHGKEHGLDAQRCVLCGDSAGGSLAAAAALSLRGTACAPHALILIYPALGADMSLPSYSENAEVPGLSNADMEFFFTSYIGGYEVPDPLAAPLTVEDYSDMPPVFVTVAEFDPLRDDGVEFHRRLLQAGQRSELRIEAGLGHSWLWPRAESVAASGALAAVIDYLSVSVGSASVGSASVGSASVGSASVKSVAVGSAADGSSSVAAGSP